MKWCETVASGCRYGDVATLIWCDSDILWEDSEDNYQGHVAILAKMVNSSYQFYYWDYGSCSGCDTWESMNLTDEQVKIEMERERLVFNTVEELEKWFVLILTRDIEALKNYKVSRDVEEYLPWFEEVYYGYNNTRPNKMERMARHWFHCIKPNRACSCPKQDDHD